MGYKYEAINKALERAEKDKKERGYFVHAVKDVYKDNQMISNWINVHTHGLEEYGLTNISIVAPENDDRLANVIYKIADMMKDGEEFIPYATHFIDNPDGTCKFKFRTLPTKCFGEDTIRLILPDPKTNEFYVDENGIEGIYCLQETTLFKDLEKVN